jgi:hypothetical protein
MPTEFRVLGGSSAFTPVYKPAGVDIWNGSAYSREGITVLLILRNSEKRRHAFNRSGTNKATWTAIFWELCLCLRQDFWFLVSSICLIDAGDGPAWVRRHLPSQDRHRL